MERETVVRLDRLTKSYGNSRGIEDVSFEVYRGEVFGFLGPNGAGKTTTIRTLLGLIHATSGQASILGIDALANNDRLRAKIGYLPGLAATYSNYTARGYLNFIAKMRGLDCSEKIEEYSARLNLALDTHIHDLSKGNKQKVSVIQAFMHQPEILFLDEPTSGLDPIVQREFEKILDETKARGATVILSSHVLSEVEHLANRVAIINEGKIIVVEEIASLKSRAVRTIDLQFPSDCEVSPFDSLPGVKVISHRADVLSVSVQGSVNSLLAKAAELGVTGITTHESSLDEIFINLVGSAE